MLVTDAGIAAMPPAPRGMLRTICSWLGLTTLMDEDSATQQPGFNSGTMAPPDDDWQRANAAMQRAILSARRGEYEPAESMFTAAFSLNRALDPSRIAAFWELDLSGLEAALRGLQSAGRQDEAMTLASDIAYRFGGHPDRRPIRAAS